MAWNVAARMLCVRPLLSDGLARRAPKTTAR